LVETLISIHTLIKIRNLRSQNIVVYLQGDAYFCDLIGNLLNCWGVEPRLGDGTSSKDYKCFDLYAPEPAERKEDLPAIISYFVGELTKNLRQHSIKVPQKICGETILFLLAYPHWYGFGHIYKFLELSLAGDWVEEDTITLFKAQELTWETFAGKTPVFSENDHARQDAERFAKGMEEQTGKESLLYDVNMHFLYENRFKAHYVDYYLYVDPALGCSIAHSFGLDYIKQVMDNACVLSGLFPSRPRLNEAQQENIDKIMQLRFQKGRAGTKFDQDSEACDNLVWYGWDKNKEIQAVVNDGLCKRENYDSFMAGLHFNLSFPDPDTTYKEWKDARDWLLKATERPHGAAVDVDSSVLDSEELPKAVLRLHKMTRELWINGKKVSLVEKKYRQFDGLVLLLTELKNNGKPVQSHRIVHAVKRREDDLKKIPKRLNVHDLYKHTPVKGLLRSAGRGFYTLNIDLSKSEVT